MALEELATNVEKFIDKCTLSGFVKPHPADAARLSKAGVVIRSSVVSATQASEAEPAAEEVLSQQPVEEVNSQDVMSQEVDGELSQKKRRRRKHHHEENEE